LGEPRTALDVVAEALTVVSGTVSPVDVAWPAAQELDTHGHAHAAQQARGAALGWLFDRPAAASTDRAFEVRLLLESGELAEAARRMAGMAPFEDLETPGVTGLVSAAAGVRVALGQPELAIDTLRQAFAAGLPFGVGFHALPMLRPLAGRPELEAPLRLRG
jgi:hypothetical protein